MKCPSCGGDNPEGLPTCAGCGTTLVAPTTVFVTLGLRPGDLFHGRFEILASLGQGGMGVVYKARDRSLEEVVAIKVLRPDFARDPVMEQRFKSEIRLEALFYPTPIDAEFALRARYGITRQIQIGLAYGIGFFENEHLHGHPPSGHTHGAHDE